MSKMPKIPKSQSARPRVNSAPANEGLDKNPAIILAGGIILGAIVAALLPKTEREAVLLGKTGSRLRNSAKGAVKAATRAGKDQLDELGVNSATARDQLRSVIEKIGQAAVAASQAASDSVRKIP